MSTYDLYAKQLDPTPRVRKLSGPFGTEAVKTVAEALAFCERKGLDPAVVRLGHNFVMWEARETPEEIAARVDRARDQQQGHLAAIREMYVEYDGRGLYGDQDRSR